MQVTGMMCSWCHRFNKLNTDGSPTYCPDCGHRTDLPRMDCDCDQCIPLRRKPLDLDDSDRPTVVE